jgi:PIN domain nuclease of toxin-antitoxin system
MDLLLDSHVFLWWDSNDRRLADPARQAIEHPENRVFVSAPTVWEIAIKRSLGKLAFSGALSAAVVANRFVDLPIAAQHAEHAAALPPHHRDPFDRILIAQALLERHTIVTHDRAFAPYGVACLWA